MAIPSLLICLAKPNFEGLVPHLLSYERKGGVKCEYIRATKVAWSPGASLLACERVSFKGDSDVAVIRTSDMEGVKTFEYSSLKGWVSEKLFRG